MSEKINKEHVILEKEIKRRRTFAIISHPDAGKTTMTEKLLLYGGAIHLAGTVKGRKAARHATSDWMDIEKQRGISVSSSVLQFEYQNYCVNILDTPGHQDFSEDTYRTLCAADAAIMMIDGGRGVEEQTIKLFEVCRLRGIPIFTFINKMDRAAKSPFDLMDELEKVLGIFAVPINWPIGTDGDFQGVFNRKLNRIELFDDQNNDHGAKMVSVKISDLEDPSLADQIGDYYHKKLIDDIELLDIAGDDLDLDKVAKGEQTPLFFGSALTNFGVEFFLQEFLKMSPSPTARKSNIGLIDPIDNPFTAFVFKIQANMNPEHRDRITFIRICSGKYEKEMVVKNVRSGKQLKLSQPQQFMAQDRTFVENAYAGDIIGLFDSGQFRIGDTLTINQDLNFEDIPVFPPEHFARVNAKDSMKRKQFQKGINQLAEEGAIQLYQQYDIGTETYIIGVIGVLQFDVLEHRLKNEYNVDLMIQRLPYHVARWVAWQDTDKKIDPNDIIIASNNLLVEDQSHNSVILFESKWSTSWVEQQNPGLILETIKNAAI
ncbi:MAG: peptide chain release factor 3 [Clostridiaceae bacterium]|nr:peptide chain release factor 3 [Clostridiaceae bacterium]